jgi:polar amino acid transport system substrate-binding protein
MLLVTAVGLPAGTQAQQTPASEIAPTGTLRVGFQTGSPILAKRAPDGSVSGVVVDLGKFIAEELGLAFHPVVYANQEAYAQSFGKDEWDMVIGARSALAEEWTDMGPDFMTADAMPSGAPDGISPTDQDRSTRREGGGVGGVRQVSAAR